jgi:hypothetical protein
LPASTAECNDTPSAVLQNDRISEPFREQIEHVRDMSSFEHEAAEIVSDLRSPLLNLMLLVQDGRVDQPSDGGEWDLALEHGDHETSLLSLVGHFGGELIERAAQLDYHSRGPGFHELSDIASAVDLRIAETGRRGKKHLAAAQKTRDVSDLPRVNPAERTIDLVNAGDDTQARVLKHLKL